MKLVDARKLSENNISCIAMNMGDNGKVEPIGWNTEYGLIAAGFVPNVQSSIDDGKWPWPFEWLAYDVFINVWIVRKMKG